MSPKEPMRSRRRDTRLALMVACLIAGTACDSLNLPALPARAADATAHDSAAATPAAKPRRGTKRAEADPALDPGRFDQIRRGLRRLVAAEESFYAENGVYTEDLSRVGFAPEGETGVRFLWLSRDGWAASGTHPDLPGRDCVIYVGRTHAAPTTLKTVRSGREGVPVCDAPQVVRRITPASPKTAAAPAAPAPAAAATPGGNAPGGNAGGNPHATGHRQCARRGRPLGADAGGSPQSGALAGYLLRPPGRLRPPHRALRAAVPVAPWRDHHHPQRQRCILVGEGHLGPASGEELRDLAGSGAPSPGHRGTATCSRTARHTGLRRLRPRRRRTARPFGRTAPERHRPPRHRAAWRDSGGRTGRWP